MIDDLSDITPDTHFLESIRADRGSYWALLAEGVDNGFDADATEIKLTLSKDLVGLHDNGIGITRDRELSIVRLGEHRSMPTTMLGMFGIGVKYHAMSAGDVLVVESVSSDGRMTLSADWSTVIQSGRWRIPRPKWMPVVRPLGTGTHLKIRSLRWPAPTPKDLKTTVEKLSQWFYPALANGKVIRLNDEQLPVLSEPDMRHVVEGDVRLPSGKGAHVRGGITIDQSSLYQVQVSYKHRVIMPQSLFGCGHYTGTRQMFARVELTGPWTLGRFKDRLSDNEANDLEDAVLEILRPVLEECHSAQMAVHVNEMTALLNEMLPPELQPVRPLKSQTRKPGGKRGRPHGKSKDGDEKPDGPARKLRHSHELMITFEQPLVSEYGYGHYVPGRPGRIMLAMDNPHIASLMHIRDKVVGAQNLYAIALMIYHAERPANQPALPFDDNGYRPFGLQVWSMMKQQNVDDSAVA